jgi:uncharacterized protein YjbJ (UPF0337 family)
MVDKEQIKGRANKAKGTIREAVGKATGNDQQIAKGRAEQAEGEAQELVGDIRGAAQQFGDKAKRTAKAVGDAVKDVTRGNR